MIITQFLRAFPGTNVYIYPDSTDKWEAFRTQTHLQPGMTEWLTHHNLMAEPARHGGYAVRWISGPDDERKMVKAIAKHAETNIDDVVTGIAEGLYVAKENPEIDGDVIKLREFVRAATEAGLL